MPLYDKILATCIMFFTTFTLHPKNYLYKTRAINDRLRKFKLSITTEVKWKTIYCVVLVIFFTKQSNSDKNCNEISYKTASIANIK